MPQGVPKKKNSNEKRHETVMRERLLREFDMITEEELAVLFDVDIKTLKNRSSNDLPPFTKTGAKRLFFRDDVMTYLKSGRNRS